MNNYYACDRCQIPFTCTTCPIRHVEMRCCQNNSDLGDWKFWQRSKKKWPVADKKKREQRNCGLLNELCKKTGCNEEILKYVLIARAFSAEQCTCQHTDPFRKCTADIPFTNDATNITGTDIYGYDIDHWFPKYLLRHLTHPSCDEQQQKRAKLTKVWLEKLYDLYNSIVEPRPEDEMERYMQELLLRKQLEEEQQEEEYDYDYEIDREGRFEEQQEEDEDEDEDDSSQEDKDKGESLKKKKRKHQSRSEEERRRHLHNPIEIYYFEPLDEHQKKMLSKRYRTIPLGPMKYTPPPEDTLPIYPQQHTQKKFFSGPQYGAGSRSLLRFSPSNLRRANAYARMDRLRSPSRYQLPRFSSFRSRMRTPSLASKKSIFQAYGYT